MLMKFTLSIGLCFLVSVTAFSYLQTLNIEMPVHSFTFDVQSNTLIIASGEELLFFTFDGWMTQNYSLPPDCHAKSLSYSEKDLLLVSLCNSSQIVVYDEMQELCWDFSVVNLSYGLWLHQQLLTLLSPLNQNQTLVSIYTLNGTLLHEYTLPFQVVNNAGYENMLYLQGTDQDQTKVYITAINATGIILQTEKSFYPTSGLAVNNLYIVSAGHGIYLYRLDGSYVTHVGGYTWVNSPTIVDNAIVYFNNMANNGSMVAATLDFVDFNGNQLYSLDYAGTSPRNIHHQRIAVTSTGYLIANLNDSIQVWLRQS
jgi:hypothetical protein